MKTWNMSFAEGMTFVPPNPERTARRSTGHFGEVVTFKEWTNRKAMARSIRMQEKRESHPDDWRACVKLGISEGY